MYLMLDKRTPRRYTWGFFVFLDGLKSRLTQSHTHNTSDHLPERTRELLGSQLTPQSTGAAASHRQHDFRMRYC
jgi:hypothetical protein